MTATPEFYCIHITRNGSATFDEIKQKMDSAVDWYRVSESFWIVYTTSDTEKWFARLAPFVKPSGSLFICKLDVSTKQGWMNADFWSWLRREKKSN